jgi:hypothetical protein
MRANATRQGIIVLAKNRSTPRGTSVTGTGVVASPPGSGAHVARVRSRRRADRYLVAADAPSTVRAYTADWKHFSLWCTARQLTPMPATPDLVGDYLSDLGEGYAKSTLHRKVAAIARANRHAGHPLDTRHPSIRDVLRGIGPTHGGPPKRVQALATEELQRLVATCTDGLVGLRDRALRRSELCGGRGGAHRLEAEKPGTADPTLED